MLGTIVNTATIIIGSAIGATLRQGIAEKYQKVMFDALGLACIVLGINASISNIPNSEFPVLFIASLVIGILIGTWLDWAGKLERYEASRKRIGKTNLIQGLTTGCLLYCIGTFAIVGPVLSALSPSAGWDFRESQNTFLYTNATLDLFTSAILAATYGWGMILAAPILFCWQSIYYCLAYFFRSAMPEEMRVEISIVGGVLILCSGLSILNIKNLKTINYLPALLVPVFFYLFLYLFRL